MRLDRYLTASNVGSRSEVKDIVRKGFVSVNNTVCKDSSYHIAPEDVVCVNGQEIKYVEHVYYMLNKPPGYVSATEDDREKTILDLFPERLRKGLFPVGRLDKDSVGLLLVTDDGALAHRLMSPKRHVDKRYLIHTDAPLDEGDIRSFEEGMVLSDGTVLKRAKLEVSKDDPYNAVVTISEGKYHQVKRMIQHCGKKVLYLKRIAVGDLELDPDLEEGKYRQLSPYEIELISR